MLDISDPFASVDGAFALVLLEAESACSGEGVVAAILAAGAGFAVAEAAAFDLGVGEGNEAFFNDAVHVFKIEAGGLSCFEGLEVPGGGRGVPAAGFLVLIVPAADGVLGIYDPLDSVLGGFVEVGDVVAEGLAEGVAFAEGVGGDGVLVAPEAFGVVEEAAFVLHGFIDEVDGGAEDGVAEFL